ncbi:hypothetical protein P0082_11775 [Candidatus Haliotispira prima]|uniref:Uncharacterized protein n=1 Tax=Candidatus Haliotispira prima TaxID=3034016 RepID=A0ABY8MK06_9SPIO|nr:hypothetical protein P0082_11775 [Candidatus Haliotispira prima]
MASSLQLEMSSSFAITTIGAVIRLATEAVPTKAEAQANAGYVSLGITAASPRKFSISQHYGSDFTNGLTPDDVLTPNTAYKLYLFFEANAIPSETTVEGATLNNGVIALSFSTATLPPAGDAVWARSLTGEQFVGSLPEWGYSENQKGVFVVYTQFPNSFASIRLSTRIADNRLDNLVLGNLAIGFLDPNPQFLFNILKLGGSYPDTDNYYCVVAADNTGKISGRAFELDMEDPSTSFIPKAALTRYSSP